MDREPRPGRTPATDADRRALASVLRLRILALCRHEELTNQQIAERVGKAPATTLHHVRTLVDQGFLVEGEPRRGSRGSRERPYASSGRSWQLDFGAPGSAGSVQISDLLVRAFLDELTRLPPGSAQPTRAGLRLSPARIEELRVRLDDVIREFVADQDADGEAISVFLSTHPDPDAPRPLIAQDERSGGPDPT